jgi:hypothetical protein
MENPALKRHVADKGLSATDVVLVGVLLAAGAVLRLFTPPFFGITPNFVIVMYCLAIYLIKPRFIEMIGISLVAAAVCHFTTKSVIPYINFISEPVGAIVAYLLVKSPINLSIKKYSFKPAFVTLIGTLASGLVYVTIQKFLLLFRNAPNSPAYTFLLTVVITTAIANTVIAQVVYYPIKTSLGKKD